MIPVLSMKNISLRGLDWLRWHGIVTAFTPRMTAADPLYRQYSAGTGTARLHGLQGIARTARRKTTAAAGSKQKDLSRRNRPAIGPNGENQDVLGQVHVLILEQASSIQHGQVILFNLGILLARDRIARHQNQFDGLRQIMLVSPERLTEQAPGAAAFHGAAYFFTGNDSQSGLCAGWQPVPIGNQATQHQSIPFLPDPGEIAVLREARRTTQSQAFRRGIHKIKPESGVCAHSGGGWPAWPSRFWWNCG
jgi:hypothetical protein